MHQQTFNANKTFIYFCSCIKYLIYITSKPISFCFLYLSICVYDCFFILMKIGDMEGDDAEQVHSGIPYVTLPHYLHYPSQNQKPMLTSSFSNMEFGEDHHALKHLDPSHGLDHLPLCYSQLQLPVNNSNNPIHIPVHKSSPTNTPSNRNNNSDEAKAVLDDRKKKRMFSNRELARRSRMRKKQQIEVLQYHVEHLQTLNHQLSQKIIYFLECNQQNAQLKEKVSSLKVALSDLLVPVGHATDQPQHIPGGFLSKPSTQTIASSGA
ncbi:hypothetical protein HN51_003155 [Arachis hypogaea]